ncbi:MAG: hypothetical protein U0521_08200 [Anaerolineae bacterium]
MTKLPLTSRMTSSSYSFQPSTLISISTSGTGLCFSPLGDPAQVTALNATLPP